MADATSSDTLVNVSDQQKRRDYLGWEEYFMGIALLSSKRSKDPRTQVILIKYHKVKVTF